MASKDIDLIVIYHNAYIYSLLRIMDPNGKSYMIILINDNLPQTKQVDPLNQKNSSASLEHLAMSLTSLMIYLPV